MPVSPHPANSQPSALGLTSVASPIRQSRANGQSVENVQSATLPPNGGGDVQRTEEVFWFVIRATQGRAQAVYDTLVNHPDFPFEAYVPRYHFETLRLLNGSPVKHIEDGLIYRSLVFVRMPLKEFRKLVHAEAPYPFVKGLTPYYNHFRISSSTGHNEYLIVPDDQFYNFRTLLQSRDTHILIDQAEMPTYLTGKKVEIVDGPFTGITGTLLRWKGLRRVFIQLDQLGTFATGFIRTCDFRLLEEGSTPS